MTALRAAIVFIFKILPQCLSRCKTRAMTNKSPFITNKIYFYRRLMK